MGVGGEQRAGTRRIYVKNASQVSGLLNQKSFIVIEKNEIEVWGLGENHEFGLRYVEFKLTLGHAKRKK